MLWILPWSTWNFFSIFCQFSSWVFIIWFWISWCRAKTFGTRKNFSSVSFPSCCMLSPMTIAFFPNFSMFLAFVLAFSWHEPKIPKMPQSSDAPNMMRPVPINATAPAAAAVIANALLDLWFFLISVPFRKEDTPCFIFGQVFLGERYFLFLFLIEAGLLSLPFRLCLWN